MLAYIIRRILIFIPTLIVISLLAFTISIMAPGDPVERILNASGENTVNNKAQKAELFRNKRHELGLDLPVFYFSLGTQADPDHLSEIDEPATRKMLVSLGRKTGNKYAVWRYYESIKHDFDIVHKDTIAKARTAENILSGLLTSADNIPEKLRQLSALHYYYRDTSLHDPEGYAESLCGPGCYDQIAYRSTRWAAMMPYIPAIHFYGKENQYHKWLMRILLRGDFGTSFQTQLPVLREIRTRLPWSFALSLISVILAFGISIPIGMYSARYKDRLFDKASGIILFMMYALPNFFVASLLLVFFANSHFLNWFPESGIQDALNFDNNWPFWVKVQHWAPYLVLPIITYSYSSIAFLSRQMRVGAIDIFNKDYIKTARAKGLSERTILWKHVFRNALMPIITVFAHVFPAAITGSIIIETIFALPGMGQEIFEAIFNYDYPVIVAVFTIFGFLTLLGYLVSDILYAFADPRISYSKK